MYYLNYIPVASIRLGEELRHFRSDSLFSVYKNKRMGEDLSSMPLASMCTFVLRSSYSMIFLPNLVLGENIWEVSCIPEKRVI